MTPEEQAIVEEKLKEVAEILYRNTPTAEFKTFESIELSVKDHLLKTVAPEIGNFFQHSRRKESRKRENNKNLYRSNYHFEQTSNQTKTEERKSFKPSPGKMLPITCGQ